MYSISERYNFVGDKVALEDLRNHSFCIRTKDGIRNIVHDEDLYVYKFRSTTTFA